MLDFEYPTVPSNVYPFLRALPALPSYRLLLFGDAYAAGYTSEESTAGSDKIAHPLTDKILQLFQQHVIVQANNIPTLGSSNAPVSTSSSSPQSIPLTIESLHFAQLCLVPSSLCRIEEEDSTSGPITATLTSQWKTRMVLEEDKRRRAARDANDLTKLTNIAIIWGKRRQAFKSQPSLHPSS